MAYFKVRNFERFQHYTDRRPPWIKLYRDLWDDPRFFKLSEADRYHLIGLFIVASQNENKVLDSQEWLKSKLLTKRNVPIELLISEGWLEWCDMNSAALTTESASTVLATRKPSRARGETETEVQKNRDTEILERVHAGFEELWVSYPAKDGRKEAEKHYKASVKTDEDLADIRRALKNYLRHLKQNPWKQPKNGRTWFNNWRDWVNWIEPEVRPNGKPLSKVDQEIARSHIHTNRCMDGHCPYDPEFGT